MKRESTTKKAILVFLTIYCIVGGVGLTCIGVEYAHFRKYALETIGTITRVDTYYKQDGNDNNVKHYNLFVEFLVRDKLYSGELKDYHKEMRKGQTVKIYYNFDNPSDFRGESSMPSTVLVISGVILVCIGTVIILLRLKHKNDIIKFKQNSELVMADITEVKLENTSRDSTRHTIYKVICRWTDYTTGTAYIMASEDLRRDPRVVLRNKNIVQLPVYIDRQNIKSYFIDTDVFYEKKVKSPE